MTSAHDLYKGTARGKRKGETTGKSSQQLPKKSRVDEPTVGVPSGVPVVEVVESPPRRAESPPAGVIDEPRVEVSSVPSPVEEPMVGSTSRDTRQEVFDSVFKMAVERAESVHKNKKYIKASHSFPGHNFDHAFSREANDITMVYPLFVHLP